MHATTILPSSLFNHIFFEDTAQTSLGVTKSIAYTTDYQPIRINYMFVVDKRSIGASVTRNHPVRLFAMVCMPYSSKHCPARLLRDALSFNAHFVIVRPTGKELCTQSITILVIDNRQRMLILHRL